MVLVLTVVLMETPEGERRSLPEVIPVAFPPPIFSNGSLLSPVSWFCVSPLPPFETHRGTIFIVGFRSRRSHGDEDRRHRSLEGQIGGSTRPRNLATWAYLFWPSGFHFSASFAPTLCSFQKLMLVNFQVIWTSFGSLKHQNIENRVFCQWKVNSTKIGKL